MSSCESVPTETQFSTQLVTSNSLSTTFSTSVTTLPSTTSTSTITICLDTVTSATCSSSTTSTTLITISGSTSTTSVPVTVTVPVTLTTSNPVRTLFSTSCRSITTPTQTPTAQSTTPTSSSSTPFSSQATATFTSLSTPPPTTFTSATSTTLPNGSVVTSNVILTSTLPPSSVVITETSPSLNHDGGGKPSAKIAPIVGGVVGGLALLAILIGIWYIWRRSKRWNDIFDQEEDEKEQRRPRMSLDAEDEQPRPYHYGLVGHSASPSPPSSPPTAAMDGLHSPSNSLSLLNAPPNQQSRSSSGLALPSSGSRSQSDLGYSPVSAHSGHVRPNLSTSSSVAASTRPLLERSVHSRPPSSWSVGGQSIGPSAEAATSVAPSSTSLGPRPHSAGGNMQSAALSRISGGAVGTADPRSSLMNEKRRIQTSLPHGASPPVIPSIPPLAFTQSPRSDPRPVPMSPPPRNPNRPSSAKGSAVVVHVDGGPAGARDAGARQAPPGNEPPAYSPT